MRNEVCYACSMYEYPDDLEFGYDRHSIIRDACDLRDLQSYGPDVQNVMTTGKAGSLGKAPRRG